MANGKKMVVVLGKKKKVAGARKARRRAAANQQTQPNVPKTRTRKSSGVVPRNRVNMVNNSDFVRLTLDPCNGPLTRSPFGASENSYIWRLNTRQTFTANSQGNALVALYANGAFNAFSGSVYAPSLQIWNGSGLSDTATVTSDLSFNFPGSTQLAAIASQVKVTAGCVGIKYIGPANNAAGELIGWEGQGDEVFATSAINMVNRMSLSTFATNGVTFPITAGVEANLNYAKAPPQQWLYADPKVANTSVFCPFAVVGVSGGASLGSYVIEATLVVEWTPLLSTGIPAPEATLFQPSSADMVANAIKSVAPLLVSAGKVALGGYAGAFGSAIKFGSKVAKSVMS